MHHQNQAQEILDILGEAEIEDESEREREVVVEINSRNLVLHGLGKVNLLKYKLIFIDLFIIC